MIKFVRPLSKTFSSYPRLFIQRNQTHKFVNLFNKKTPVENELNDELENLSCQNTIEWNKKMKFYRMSNQEQKALKLFEIGIRKHQFQPDYITYISLLELCKDMKDVDNGRYLHRIISSSSIKDNTRIQNLLFEMYMTGGDLESAKEMFDSLKHRTVVEFNSLMSTYNTNHLPERTIELFHEMRQKYNIKPVNLSYILYFQACVMLKSFDQAKALHEELKTNNPNYIKNKELVNQIIAMYLASDNFSLAEEYFKQIKEPNLENFRGLIDGYSQAKNYEAILQLYDQLKSQRKIQIDVPIYVSVLTACKQLNNSTKIQEIRDDLTKQNLWLTHPDIEKFFSN